ncbi:MULTISPECIES: hypothetical protein [Idiomarina]|jgi:hypothetical protein|uniref:hypothetical protein n=1 Tax=Idiomarina TaxID=135575 RepID=UPI000C0906A4|nr:MULTISPECIES: hypothetical protein [Idiomarina]MAC32192.1 hypothetical protein [Haliea sp.]MAO67099.1 hypothetical protein [Idiomarina sp.]MBF80221.1 hypothetical protein [Idiomarina sp.]|tara:strand:+ start:1320 stop:1967 length:648 start_codon:yes stop_codon:yes gene_type:complete
MNMNPVSNNASYPAATTTQSDKAQEPVSKDVATGEDKESFIDKAYRSILLNRMGVDTGHLDEIEQKIEELESKSSLTKEEKDELNSLMEARDQLFEDAMRRQAEEGNNSSQSNIPIAITENFNARKISPNDMSELASQLFEAGVITHEQRSAMSFQISKTSLHKTFTPESQQIDPDEPMDFVKFWEDRVKANDYFDVSAKEKAKDQGILDVLRQV